MKIWWGISNPVQGCDQYDICDTNFPATCMHKEEERQSHQITKSVKHFFFCNGDLGAQDELARPLYSCSMLATAIWSGEPNMPQVLGGQQGGNAAQLSMESKNILGLTLPYNRKQKLKFWHAPSLRTKTLHVFRCVTSSLPSTHPTTKVKHSSWFHILYMPAVCDITKDKTSSSASQDYNINIENNNTPTSIHSHVSLTTPPPQFFKGMPYSLHDFRY